MSKGWEFTNKLPFNKNINFIGSGWTSWVFKTKLKHHKMYKFALKVMFTNTKINLQSFQNEVQILSKLSSHNICPEVIHSWYDDDYGYIVMPLLHEIYNLTDEMKLQCHNKLQKMNSLKIIHGDIALDNIMVTDEGNIMFIDMGLSVDFSRNSFFYHEHNVYFRISEVPTFLKGSQMDVTFLKNITRS